MGDGSAANLAWRLLESFIAKHEIKLDSRLHKIVTNKLLQLGVFLPHWLVASYKVNSKFFFFFQIKFNLFCLFLKLRNPAELLRLLFENGRLEEAALLASEYLEAALGKGKDRLNLNTSLLPLNPSTWVPLNNIDLLLMELEAHSQDDATYKQVRIFNSFLFFNYTFYEYIFYCLFFPVTC